MKQIRIELKSLSWKNFLALLLAGCINAFGVTVFLAPVKLYDSGISGTSMLLSQITPEYLTLSVFLLILNVPLFLFGLKKQGIGFTIYSLFTVTVYSVGSWLITDVLPIDVRMVSPLAGEDLLLCALFGGMISADHPLWRRAGRHRGAGGDLREEAQSHRGNLCDDLQFDLVSDLRRGHP